MYLGITIHKFKRAANSKEPQIRTNVTFKGSQEKRLPELTSTRTKFNLIPRGSKGQSIAQAHKGFFIRPNNFITKQSGSGVAVLRLCVELCCGSN